MKDDQLSELPVGKWKMYQEKMLILPSAKACIAFFKESYFLNAEQMTSVHQDAFILNY